MADDDLVNAWLQECRSPNTRYQYQWRIKAFLAWYKKPLGTFLALQPREMRHVALQFQNEAVAGWSPGEKPLRHNTIISILTALGSLASTNDRPLMLRGKRLRIEIDVDSHSWSNQDLSRMYEVGNLQEKAYLALSCSLGWEVSSVLGLRRDFVWGHIERAREAGEKFVYFLDQRKKTSVPRLGVLNPLALSSLEEWLKKHKGLYCFKFRTRMGAGNVLKRLAREANIKTVGRVHTHSLRAWVISGLSRAGMNEWQIKHLVGKSIPVSDSTYLRTLQQEIMERYPVAYENYLNIHGPSVEQKRELNDVKRELVKLREYVDRYIRERSIERDKEEKKHEG